MSGLSRLDERALGPRGAALLAVVAVLFLAYAVASFLLGAWPLGLALLVLTGLCARSSVRAWSRRTG